MQTTFAALLTDAIVVMLLLKSIMLKNFPALAGGVYITERESLQLFLGNQSYRQETDIRVRHSVRFGDILGHRSGPGPPWGS